MNAAIRPVRPTDAGAIAAIYRPFVIDTSITFEFDPPDPAEIAARIARVTATHPWLIAERDGTVIGYAYAGPYRTRAAYDWVAETAIYMARDQAGKGIGTQLYQALLEQMAQAGFVAAIGVMTGGVAGSAALHEKLGFRVIGVQPGVGFKHGRWHDVVIWQRDLAPRRAAPQPPAPRP